MTIKYRGNRPVLPNAPITSEKWWFDNLAARSIVSATVYLRSLGLYCELNQTNQKALLKVAKTKAFRDAFSDFIR